MRSGPDRAEAEMGETVRDQVRGLEPVPEGAGLAPPASPLIRYPPPTQPPFGLPSPIR